MTRKLVVPAALLFGGALLFLVMMRANRPSVRYELGRGDAGELALPDYGRLRLDITAAGVRIVPGEAGRVRIHAERVPHLARVAQRVHDSSAVVEISNLGNNSQLLIEVPLHTDLQVDLGAGELKIFQVLGDKQLSARAGRIEVENPASAYGRVSAFVLTGRVFAPAFGDDTGGIWRARHWSGKGRSRLEANVLAGEIFLRNSESASRLDAGLQF